MASMHLSLLIVFNVAVFIFVGHCVIAEKLSKDGEALEEFGVHAAGLDRRAWSILMEECPGTEEVLSEISWLLKEYGVPDLLQTTACNNPLSLSWRVFTLASGEVKRLTVVGASGLHASVQGSGTSIEYLNLDDHLFLYQKSGLNFAARLIRAVLVEWLWKNIYFYTESYYEDDFLSNIHAARGLQEPFVVEQFCTVWRVRPWEFVRRLMQEEVRHRRSIVVIANATVTHQLLKLASRANLFSDGQQWLIVSDSKRNWTSSLQLTMDSQVYAVRHAGPIRDMDTLLVEYVKAQPVLIEAGAQSVLLENGTYGRWSGSIPSAVHFLEVVVQLEILNLYLNVEGRTKSRSVARWSPTGGLNTFAPKPRFSNYEQRRLRIVTSESPPYVMIERHLTTGDLTYSGYLVDVLLVVASVLNFTIEYVPVAYSVPGVSTNSSWNGVVDLLVRKQADVGLLDLTITPDRLLVVDFAEVAVDAQATAGLYRRPGSDGQGIDKFGVYLEPFDLPVWIASIVAVVVLISSLCSSLWLTQHLTASLGNIWENDQLNASRAILLGFQAIAQQGCELSFGNPSSRVVFLVLWFFALIAYSSYSATLMSYLTVNRIYLPFDSLSSLAHNKDYRVGFLQGSSDLELFRESASSHYQAVWKRIVQQQFSTIVDGYSTGLARAYNEKFVLLSDDRTMQYMIRNTCDLVVSSPLTSSHFVTLAFQKDSPHQRAVSRVLRSMNDAGILYRLRDKWWGSALFCQQEAQMFTSLSLTNVATGFLLLVGGIVGGTLGLLAEGMFGRCGGGGQPPVSEKSTWRMPVGRLPHRRKFLHF